MLETKRMQQRVNVSHKNILFFASNDCSNTKLLHSCLRYHIYLDKEKSYMVYTNPKNVGDLLKDIHVGP